MGEIIDLLRNSKKINSCYEIVQNFLFCLLAVACLLTFARGLMKVVVDVNVWISALLWRGIPVKFYKKHKIIKL
jgi:hypothetical protein